MAGRGLARGAGLWRQRGLALLALGLGALALSGCLGASAPQSAEITTEALAPLPEAAAEAAAAPEAVTPAEAVPVAEPVQPEVVPVDIAPSTPPDPPFIAEQRRLCERGGGQLTPRGGGAFTCVQLTRDGGRRCEASSQCEGVCLARSNSCAPLEPLYGCHDVWVTPGNRVTQCLE